MGLSFTNDKMPVAAAAITAVALIVLVMLHRGFAGISVTK